MATSTTALINQVREHLEAPMTLEAASTQAQALDDIQAAERLKSALSAFQARRTADLAEQRETAEKQRGVPKSRRCKGLAGEIALARGDAPARGTHHLALAQALTKDLRHTMAALAQGRIQEDHARAVTKETEWLNQRDRRTVDQLIDKDFDGVGPRKLGNIVRDHAQRLDPKTATNRLADAESKRRVYVKPLDNGMGELRGVLPLPQAVAIFENLRATALRKLNAGDSKDAAGQKRSRDQLMADTLVERGTGQQSADTVPTQINLVMDQETLFDAADTPAWLTGHGPIPAGAARTWLSNPDMKVFVRRIFTRPQDQQLVALESRSREFPVGLRHMLFLRDDTCAVPYCEATIQDADHRQPVRLGGATTFQNGSGLCGACNQRKENIGWKHTGDAHSLTVTTPTGHQYSRPTRRLKPPEQTGYWPWQPRGPTTS